jgi:long-chain acyl-CoA synthetase
MISGGAKIGYFQGDTMKLMDDIVLLKPTIFVSVPRLFNRLYDKVFAAVKIKGGVAAQLFNMAYNAKRNNLRKNGQITHAFWDKLVFSSIRERLGGRVSYIVSGSAPISPEVLDFFRICFSANVVEGYGQTENATGLTIGYKYDTSSGHVGPPQLCCEVKLVDIPEMNYTSKDKPYPRGEIRIRGASVFPGYYKSPKQTAETFDKNGWCHTGDIGMWDERGRLVIIDRVKNIFKLSQGEYIAPEKIETILSKHCLVAQAFIYGNSLESRLVGIIIPDAEILPAWAAENGLGGKNFKELCREPKLKETLLKELDAFGRDSDLKGFELLKNIYVGSEYFTVENDLLTPSFKPKRHKIQAKYQEEITVMYADLKSK